MRLGTFGLSRLAQNVFPRMAKCQRGSLLVTNATAALKGDPLLPGFQSCCTLRHSSSTTSTNLTERTRRMAEDLLAVSSYDRHSEVSNQNNNNNKPSSTRIHPELKRRLALSRAITLVESRLKSKQQDADALLEHIMAQPQAAQDICDSFRLGIAGAPGAGKSSLIEVLGTHVLEPPSPGAAMSTSEGSGSSSSGGGDEDPIWYPKKLAVICIDPSSDISGGSILGDKTRMVGLSSSGNSTISGNAPEAAEAQPPGIRAYVRPAPTGDSLGGLAGPSTVDAMDLCAAAGHDLVICETVGVGQSQSSDVAQSVDVVLLALPPAGGDGLQGMKRGIMEVADIIVVTKADGDLLPAAKRAAGDYRNAMQFVRPALTRQAMSLLDVGPLPPPVPLKPPPVLMVSSVTGEGISELWQAITQIRQERIQAGLLTQRRREQRRYWMWQNLQLLVKQRTMSSPQVAQVARDLQKELEGGRLPSRVAAGRLLQSLIREQSES